MPGGITGGVVETQIDKAAGQVGIDVAQFGYAGSRFRFFPNFRNVFLYPDGEITRLAGVVEGKNWGALHGIADDGAGDAAAEIEHFDAAIVGSDQCAFGCGQGDDEIALRVFAVDGKRTGEANGNLGDACKVFHIAGRDVGIE